MSHLADLASDDELLDALGARSAASDPLGRMLSTWASYCDEPIAPVVPIGRTRGRRRRGVVIGVAIIGITAGGATGAAATGDRVPLIAPLLDRFVGLSPMSMMHTDLRAQSLPSPGDGAATWTTGAVLQDAPLLGGTSADRASEVHALPAQPAATSAQAGSRPSAARAQVQKPAVPHVAAAPTLPSQLTVSPTAATAPSGLELSVGPERPAQPAAGAETSIDPEPATDQEPATDSVTPPDEDPASAGQVGSEAVPDDEAVASDDGQRVPGDGDRAADGTEGTPEPTARPGQLEDAVDPEPDGDRSTPPGLVPTTGSGAPDSGIRTLDDPTTDAAGTARD